MLFSTDVTILSWTSVDPHESSIFSSWGVLYRFSTDISRGMTITTLWRALWLNQEDRVCRLEWSSNGGLHRAVIGKPAYSNCDRVLILPTILKAASFDRWPISVAVLTSTLTLRVVTPLFGQLCANWASYLRSRWVGPDKLLYTRGPATGKPDMTVSLLILMWCGVSDMENNFASSVTRMAW